jgi:hypothetical protein
MSALCGGALGCADHELSGDHNARRDYDIHAVAILVLPRGTDLCPVSCLAVAINDEHEVEGRLVLVLVVIVLSFRF